MLSGTAFHDGQLFIVLDAYVFPQFAICLYGTAGFTFLKGWLMCALLVGLEPLTNAYRNPENLAYYFAPKVYAFECEAVLQHASHVARVRRAGVLPHHKLSEAEPRLLRVRAHLQNYGTRTFWAIDDVLSRRVGPMCLFVCLLACLFVCFVLFCLFVCLFVHLFVLLRVPFQVGTRIRMAMPICPFDTFPYFGGVLCGSPGSTHLKEW